MKKQILSTIMLILMVGFIELRVFNGYFVSLNKPDQKATQKTIKIKKSEKIHTKNSVETRKQVELLPLNKIEAEQKSATLPSNALLDVPLIKQLPELPRGCGVTSLAMLLNYAGYAVSKETLAKQIKKDPIPYNKINGRVHFGNPNTGFAGAMDTLNKPGIGVYHGPITQLAERYMGKRIIDITGKPFASILHQIVAGAPAWVINNTLFTKLGDNYWEAWNTPEGPIDITYKEHSVLITGYDKQWIYFNDPLAGQKDRHVKKTAFIEDWKQMGGQAISYNVLDKVQFVNKTVTNDTR